MLLCVFFFGVCVGESFVVIFFFECEWLMFILVVLGNCLFEGW